MKKKKSDLEGMFWELIGYEEPKRPVDPRDKGIPDFPIRDINNFSFETIRPKPISESLEKYLYGNKINRKIIIKNENYIKKMDFIKEMDYSNKMIEELNSKFRKYSNLLNPNLQPYMSMPFGSAIYSPMGLNVNVKDSTSISAYNLGQFALPIVEYIHAVRPDCIIACDRGARLLGLAVHRLHQQLYGKLPTTDGTLRFRRISKSNSEEETEEHLRPLINEMLIKDGKQTVLVLDDWVVSGETKRIAQRVFDRLGKGRIKVKFGVLVGEGADISGHSSRTSGFAGVTDWHDNSNIIGVQYGKDAWFGGGINPRPVRSEEAKSYRERMREGINKLVESIKQPALT